MTYNKLFSMVVSFLNNAVICKNLKLFNSADLNPGTFENNSERLHSKRYSYILFKRKTISKDHFFLFSYDFVFH